MARFNLGKAAEVLRGLEHRDGEDFRRLVQRLKISPEEVQEWAKAAEAHVHPVRRGHRNQPAGLPLP